jgi:hypothetical protein
MTNYKSATIVIAIAVVMISSYMVIGLQTVMHEALALSLARIAAPVAVSGNNIYTAWTNVSSALHSVPVFFTKSNDGGKTFAKTIVISSPNNNLKRFVVNENISIGASGNNVAVTWWTNKTGAFNPVIRTSNDAGNTFANIIKLNSTAGGTNK